MRFGGILLLSVGLAMDAMAVAAARGLATPKILPRHVLLVALFFGGFQGLMPLLGYALGAGIGPAVQAWDHWIAFVLLSAIGGKMLWEARNPSEALGTADLYGTKVMFTLAVATSIDALVAGITLPMMNAPLLLSLLTIALTTALLSALGLYAGQRFGAMLGKRLDVVGGLVLIAIAFKTLIEHTAAS